MVPLSKRTLKDLPLQDREKKTSRMQDSGLSAEELQRQQEMLFAASRARFEASN